MAREEDVEFLIVLDDWIELDPSKKEQAGVDRKIDLFVEHYILEHMPKTSSQKEVVKIRISTRDGNVTITGTTSNEALRKALVNVAADIEKAYPQIKRVDASAVSVEDPNALIGENYVPVFKEGLMPGSDAAINEAVLSELRGIRASAKGSETAEFDAQTVNGAVRITGATNSVMLYRRLVVDIVALIRTKIEGVKSVDHSAVKAP